MAQSKSSVKKTAPRKKNAAPRKRAARKPEPRSAARVRRHRDKMRRAGMKLLQIWVPDPTQPGFAEEVRRQCLLLRDDPHEQEILDEIAAVADFRGWK
jgi:hypothetical protein